MVFAGIGVIGFQRISPSVFGWKKLRTSSQQISMLTSMAISLNAVMAPMFPVLIAKG